MSTEVKRVIIIEIEDSSSNIVDRILSELHRDDTKVKDEREYIAIKDLEIITAEKKVLKNGVDVNLTAIEYRVLLYLVAHPGWVYTKEQIYEALWDEESDSTMQAVAIVISRLRGKIEDDPKNPEYIVTVSGFGYRFMKKEKW